MKKLQKLQLKNATIMNPTQMKYVRGGYDGGENGFLMTCEGIGSLWDPYDSKIKHICVPYCTDYYIEKYSVDGWYCLCSSNPNCMIGSYYD